LPRPEQERDRILRQSVSYPFNYDWSVYKGHLR
jgi:hypothetical protein